MSKINVNLEGKLKENFDDIDFNIVKTLLEEIEKDEKSDEQLKSELLMKIKGTIERD